MDGRVRKAALNEDFSVAIRTHLKANTL